MTGKKSVPTAPSSRGSNKASAAAKASSIGSAPEPKRMRVGQGCFCIICKRPAEDLGEGQGVAFWPRTRSCDILVATPASGNFTASSVRA